MEGTQPDQAPVATLSRRRGHPGSAEQARREAWGRKWGPILAAISAAAKKGRT